MLKIYMIDLRGVTVIYVPVKKNVPVIYVIYVPGSVIYVPLRSQS